MAAPRNGANPALSRWREKAPPGCVGATLPTVIPAYAGIQSARKRHDGARCAPSLLIPSDHVIPAKAGTYPFAALPA